MTSVLPSCAFPLGSCGPSTSIVQCGIATGLPDGSVRLALPRRLPGSAPPEDHHVAVARIRACRGPVRRLVATPAGHGLDALVVALGGTTVAAVLHISPCLTAAAVASTVPHDSHGGKRSRPSTTQGDLNSNKKQKKSAAHRVEGVNVVAPAAPLLRVAVTDEEQPAFAQRSSGMAVGTAGAFSSTTPLRVLLKGHVLPVSDARVLPCTLSGASVATASLDGSVRFFHPGTGACHRVVDLGPSRPALALAMDTSFHQVPTAFVVGCFGAVVRVDLQPLSRPGRDAQAYAGSTAAPTVKVVPLPLEPFTTSGEEDPKNAVRSEPGAATAAYMSVTWDAANGRCSALHWSAVSGSTSPSQKLCWERADGISVPTATPVDTANAEEWAGTTVSHCAPTTPYDAKLAAACLALPTASSPSRSSAAPAEDIIRGDADSDEDQPDDADPQDEEVLALEKEHDQLLKLCAQLKSEATAAKRSKRQQA